jgi:hypothetical protein
MWISKVYLALPTYSYLSWELRLICRLDQYFRIGHMGISAVDPQRGDINKVIKSLQEALEEVRAAKAKVCVKM